MIILVQELMLTLFCTSHITYEVSCADIIANLMPIHCDDEKCQFHYRFGEMGNRHYQIYQDS